MRVCVLFGGKTNSEKLRTYATEMAQGISASGHIVDIINMNLEEGKIISFYDYIVVISEGESFFG